MDNQELCNSIEVHLKDIDVTVNRFIRIKERVIDIFYTGIGRIKLIYYKIIRRKSIPSLQANNLNLQPGDIVEVKSLKDVSLSLDYRRRHKGLYFMPEMEEFCGKKFSVYKNIKIIKLECSGELKKIKTPTVFLEGVYCNGKYHGNCDRSCFLYWHDIWLKKVPDLR